MKPLVQIKRVANFARRCSNLSFPPKVSANIQIYVEIKCKKETCAFFVHDSKTFLALQKIYGHDFKKALLTKKLTVKPLKLDLKIYNA